MKKKITTILLLAALFAALFSLGAQAAEPSGSCGDALTWTLDGDGTLTVSGAGAMTDYYQQDDGSDVPPWDEYKSEIKTLILESGVTTLGSYSLFECAELENVTIPDTLTAFSEGALGGCLALRNITVSEQNTEFSSIDGVLFNKDATLLIQYPIGRTEESYAIPEGVTSLAEFSLGGAAALKSVTIPDTVTEIGLGAFMNCEHLEDVTIPASVTVLAPQAFMQCVSLKSIVIPAGVTELGKHSFRACQALESITLPASVTVIGKNAFLDCEALTELHFGGSSSDWDAIAIDAEGNEKLAELMIDGAETSLSSGAVTVLVAVVCLAAGLAGGWLLGKKKPATDQE